MRIDGKKIAEEIIAGLGTSLRGRRLGMVIGTNDPATESFIKIKARVAQKLGVEVIRGELPELIKTCDGIVVQLPHPNARELLAVLPPEKDVDAVGSHPIVRAPVAEAISEIFMRSSVTAANKKAVVVGAGKLVGAPAAKLLRELGADVEVITNRDGSLTSVKNADIVVLGAGEPGLIKSDMLKRGVVLIDAGTSTSNDGRLPAGRQGKLAGDADPSCAEVCSVFTPVPGGVGPIAVAMIFRNLSILAKRA